MTIYNYCDYVVLQGCTFLVIFGLPGYKHEQDCAHALQCASRMSAALDSVPGIQYVDVTEYITFKMFGQYF